MFRDRARRCHLLFSGFGSEEPQIRHTVLSLAREFTQYANPDYSRDGGTSKTTMWDLRAAPWIHAYEERPTFYQFQILWGWREAWSGHTGDGDGGGHGDQNLVSGRDATFYQGDERERRLGADDFWTALLNGWWMDQMVQEFTSGGIWAVMFEPSTPGRRKFAEDIATAVAAELFGREEYAPRWLGLEASSAGFPVMEWSSRVGCYVPFLERPTYYALAMFFLALFPGRRLATSPSEGVSLSGARARWVAHLRPECIVLEYTDERFGTQAADQCQVSSEEDEEASASNAGGVLRVRSLRLVDRIVLWVEEPRNDTAPPFREFKMRHRSVSVDHACGARMDSGSSRPAAAASPLEIGIQVSDIAFDVGRSSKVGSQGFVTELGRALAYEENCGSGSDIELLNWIGEVVEKIVWRRCVRARPNRMPNWRSIDGMVRQCEGLSG